MIHEFSEMPKLGEVVISTENPIAEKEQLQCVMLKPDDEVPSIVYAFFQNMDDDALNDKIEDGIRFYTMKGYGIPDDQE